MHTPIKDRVTTIGKGGRRFWLYPAKFHGLWLKRRQILAAVLILFFFIVPWTKVNGTQTVLLDVAERKFAIFGAVFWPQDLIIFWFYLVGTVILIFLITAQWGRLFCGWACPQTVFLEHVFRRIETWVEGDGNQRRRLDKAPWTLTKVRKKATKYFLFLIVSSHFANTVLCYFVGTDQVINMTFSDPRENWSWFGFMAFVNFLFFVNFTWFREQFCLIACPYGRFQSVLLDGDSMIVGYDYNRGEPRGVLRKKEKRDKGDCIDCNRCVAVCPTGIDIRMGLQMECINCTACMDACDEIMDKINKPRKLIGYTSVASLEGRNRRFFRARTLVYTGLFLALFTVGSVLLVNKSEIIIRMVRPPGASFTLNQSDEITNHFQAKASNKTPEPITLKPSVPEGYELVAALDPWVVPPQETVQNQIFIRKKKDNFSNTGKESLTIRFYDGEAVATEAKITLMGPKP
ncbi:MAG: cytochrome c oxidase accessory protein CcoG [Acidobacteriota bacterium]|nr:cytochrome c oxidase accessory protein CcoG [Acidobacteriota bacterium]